MRTKILIRCMPFDFSEDDIYRLLEPHAKVENVELHHDHLNAAFDRFAVIDVETDDVAALLGSLDGRAIGNRVIKLDEIRPVRSTLTELEARHG